MKTLHNNTNDGNDITNDHGSHSNNSDSVVNNYNNNTSNNSSKNKLNNNNKFSYFLSGHWQQHRIAIMLKKPLSSSSK